MPSPILRVLEIDGGIVEGAQVPDIKPDELLFLYRSMLLNRRLDERMFKLQRQGRIGFYIGSAGEEAAIIGSAYALQPDDWIIPCYREFGAIYIRGFTLFELFCQLFGNAEDPLHGRQMPNHYTSKTLNFASVSSPVGTQIPHATGIGLAMKLSQKKQMALVYFGDGATSEGDFHVSCNFAGVFETPTLFFCRNNQWAISVPAHKQTASENFAIKAQAYGFEGYQVDGNDVLAVYSLTKLLAAKAREGGGPALIEAVTYRQGAHSTSDDPRAYRNQGEVEKWLEKDPLVRTRLYLEKIGLWDSRKETELEKEIQEEIRSALERAESIGPPQPETMFGDVFDQSPWHLREQLDELLSPDD